MSNRMNEQDAPAVRATEISVNIKGAQLLNSVSFNVERGEWLSIIGPNGAGKSTLLRSLAGAIEAGGSIEISGQSLGELSLKDRAKLVAWVPQTPSIPEGMNVTDYVLLGRTPYLSALANPSRKDLQAARDQIAQLDLTKFAARKVQTLSGGERQRVVIARSLVQDTPIILLDEPTSALDLGHQQDVLELLDHLIADSGKTIISTMHDLTLAGHFADRLLLLGGEGEVVAHGPAAEVLTEANISTHYEAQVTIARVGETVVVSPKIDRPTSFKLPKHFHQKDTSTVSKDSTTEPATTEPDKSSHSPAKSLVLVNTGDGKGKSSSAFGMMVRGVARDWNVAVVQFVKSGNWNVGEEKIGRQLGVDWHNEGQGFTWLSENLEEDKAIAQAGWDKAAALINAGDHNLVILDELTYLMNWGWIDGDNVCEVIENRPEKVSVIVTGRDASEGLIAVADTVSEMVKVKHAFDAGIVAKKGLDY